MRFNILLISTFVLYFLSNPTIHAQELVSAELKAERPLHYMTNNYGGFMENGVKLYAITYTTNDVFGQQDTASGLLAIPVRNMEYVYPLLCYQHGTVNDRNDVPSLLRGGYQLAEAMSGMGFVTFAPDYLGLGTSRGVHPYVHADSEASTSLDMLFAVKQFAANNNILLNEQLFITGYSQGGHAAMAFQREVELNQSHQLEVTASAPLSGPYSISTVMYELILGDEPYNFPGYLPNTLLGYNYVYNLFDDIVEEAFNDQYIPAIRSFQNEQINLSMLNSSLLQLLQLHTGSTVPRNLLKTSFIDQITQDDENPIFMALKDNDVYDWAPIAPTRLYYCKADDQVPYQNSIRADSVMNLNGASDLSSHDINSAFDHGQCVQPAITNTLFFFLQYRDLSVQTDSRSLKFDLKLYPNPATNSIRIADASADMWMNIYDIKGQLVLNTSHLLSEIKVDHLMPGLYYVHVLSANGLSGTSPLVIK